MTDRLVLFGIDNGRMAADAQGYISNIDDEAARAITDMPHALWHLTCIEREVVALCFLDEKTSAEAARILSTMRGERVAPSTVRRTKQRALNRIQSLLDGEHLQHVLPIY